ncbi:MAG: acetyltransferase [Granulosicoccus sp.]|nr:acetyltransferase [Granulosicoccus sp.]
MTNSHRYSFRTFTTVDLDMVEQWLIQPSVARWYPDPDYIEDLEDQLDDENIVMQLVCLDNEPFAFVQDYAIHAWSDHPLSYLPDDARGLDTFIGEPQQLNQGHGTRYLELLIEHLRASGVPALGIDPHPDNLRAIRVYEKLGFNKGRECSTEWGLVQLMSLDLASR